MISTTFNSTSNSEASSTSENSGVVFELLTDWGTGFQGKIFITNTTNECLYNTIFIQSKIFFFASWRLFFSSNVDLCNRKKFGDHRNFFLYQFSFI